MLHDTFTHLCLQLIEKEIIYFEFVGLKKHSPWVEISLNMMALLILVNIKPVKIKRQEILRQTSHSPSRWHTSATKQLTKTSANVKRYQIYYQIARSYVNSKSMNGRKLMCKTLDLRYAGLHYTFDCVVFKLMIKQNELQFIGHFGLIYCLIIKHSTLVCLCVCLVY